MTQFKIEVQGSGTNSRIVESLRILANSLEDTDMENLTEKEYEDSTIFSTISEL